MLFAVKGINKNLGAQFSDKLLNIVTVVFEKNTNNFCSRKLEIVFVLVFLLEESEVIIIELVLGVFCLFFLELVVLSNSFKGSGNDDA